MIRRDHIDACRNAGWLLVSQIEHARLAGALARAWRRPLLQLPPDSAEDVLAAIDHHDDGWETWEESPAVDSETCRPVAFDEMPQDQALAIWRESIRRCAALGPLAALTVAGHFCTLLRRFRAKTEARTQGFLEDYDARCDRWLVAWKSRNPGEHSPQDARRAVAWLQYFDAMSLWFCCAPAAKAHESLTPTGTAVCYRPAESGTVSVDPWPFADIEIQLTASGDWVPAARYEDAASLEAAPHRSHDLHWRLIPRTPTA
jgi:hypothetical protein